MINQNTNIETINNRVETAQDFMAARIASLVMPNTVAVERVEA